MALIFKKQAHFRRALRFLWPHRRYLTIAMICSVGVALAYSTSIGAILPILRLMIAEEGLQGYVYRHAASNRLDADLEWEDAPKTENASPEPTEDKQLVIRRLGKASSLTDEDAPPNSVVAGLVGAEEVDVLHELATTADDSVTLRLRPPGGESDIEVVAKLRDASSFWRTASAAIARLPFDSSRRGRLLTLVAALSLVLIINISGNICRFFAEYLIYLASFRAMMDFRRRLYAKVLTLPLTWFGRNLSDTMSRFVSDSQEIFRGYVVLFGKIAREPLKAIAVFIIALWLDYRITLAVVVGAPIAGLLLYRLGKLVRKANQRLLQGFGMMIGGLTATLNGMRVVRAYTQEGAERKRLWHIERKMLKQQLKMARIEAMTSPLIEVIGISLAMVGIVWLANQTMSGSASPAVFFQMVILLAAMFDPIRKVSQVYNRLQRADAASQRIFDLLDMPVQETRSHSRQALPTPKESITFENVTYAYPETTTPAVNGVSFTAKVGQQVAVVGPNGSGKTTLISLLLRFLDPDDGRILIDGVDTRDVSLKSLRRQISLITQDAVVFPLSLADNIGYGREHATREEIIEAAKRAHAHEFIEQIPKGYDTIAGEYGVTLSGGQRQRVALARAILRDAPIFVFDEATSQVDVESEQRIREAMTEFMKGRTSFVIAHRIATVQNADLIVVMNEARVVDAGTHAELMQRCPLYQSLYSTHIRGSGGEPSDA